MDKFAKRRWQGYKASEARDAQIERKMEEIKYNRLLLDAYRRLHMDMYGTYDPKIVDLIHRIRRLKDLPPIPMTPQQVQSEIVRLEARLRNLQRFGTRRDRPKLWDKIVSEVKKGNKGGKKGQWSARKAQLAVKRYKSRGGDYIGRKSPNNSLRKWTKQKWRTKSGRPSVVGPRSTGERYLPEKAIKALSDKEYKKATRRKRRSLKKGEQYSRMSDSTSRKVRRYRSSFGNSKKYKFSDIIVSDNKGKKYEAVFINRKTGRKKTIPFGSKGMSDFTKHRDPERKKRYIDRHRKRENWKDLMSAGALSRWILWNKPTLKASKEDYKRRLKKQGYCS